MTFFTFPSLHVPSFSSIYLSLFRRCLCLGVFLCVFVFILFMFVSGYFVFAMFVFVCEYFCVCFVFLYLSCIYLYVRLCVSCVFALCVCGYFYVWSLSEYMSVCAHLRASACTVTSYASRIDKVFKARLIFCPFHLITYQKICQIFSL